MDGLVGEMLMIGISRKGILSSGVKAGRDLMITIVMKEVL